MMFARRSRSLPVPTPRRTRPAPGARALEALESRVLFASVAGTVFQDANENGVRDAGEGGLAGWTVYDDLNNNGRFDGAAVTSNAADVPKALADPGTTTSDIVVSGATGTITDVNVTLDISHTFDEDLLVTLISPTGTRVRLFGDIGFGNNNFTNTTLDDEAATSITEGRAPFTGTFRPEEPLSALDGQNGNGTWRLEVVDQAREETGTLNSWSITVSGSGGGEPSAVTDAGGNYVLTNLPAGNHTLREVVQQGFTQTSPAGGAHAVTLAAADAVTGRDFGNTNRVIPTTVVARQIFYNHSSYDGYDAAANAKDDRAIAQDKRPLLPGQAASYENVTNYSRGINGLMIDVRRLAGTTLTADDFDFRSGNSADPTGWLPAAAPRTVTLRPGDAATHTTRVTLVWDDGAITNRWLQVTLKANVNTGLSAPDVFYVGNLVGEVGNDAVGTGWRVNTADLLAARNSLLTRVPAIINRYDFNRDGVLNVLDVAIVRGNMGGTLPGLTPPVPTAGAAPFSDALVSLRALRDARAKGAAAALPG